MTNFIFQISRIQWMRCVACVILISAFMGCKRDDTKDHLAVQEQSLLTQSAPVPPEAPSPETVASRPPPSLPRLSFQLPDGWKEEPPREMRAASFTAFGTRGQSADVSVVPLPIVGGDLELINMWREQVQLPATSDPDAVKLAQPVAIGAEQGRLFEFVSGQPVIGQTRRRILVARLTLAKISWFFKITGEDSFVASQQESFLQFLKSVSLIDNELAQLAGVPATGERDGESSPAWSIPTGWRSMPPSQFLLAEFSIAGTNGTQAEVNVAEFGGDGGGLPANVNRWRRQLGLKSLGKILTTPLHVTGAAAQMVDFTGTDSKTGQPARLVGAIVPRNGRTWFYKLTGDGQIVARQKDAFIKFVQSADYANGSKAR